MMRIRHCNYEKTRLDEKRLRNLLFGCQKSHEIKNPLRLHVNVMEFQFHKKKIKKKNFFHEINLFL